MRPQPRKGIAGGAVLLLIPAAAALAGHFAFQLRTADRLAVSPYWSIFLLARMAEDGTAKTYLEAHCAERRFFLCGSIDRLPMSATAFLWRTRGPLHLAGGPDALVREAQAIVLGALRDQTGRFMKLAAASGVRQLRLFATTRELTLFDFDSEGGQRLAAFVRDRLPGDYPALARSRQIHGPGSLATVDRIGLWTVLASAVGLIALLPPLFRRGRRAALELVALVAAGIVVNAFICGALSGAYPRYQSRIVWLLPFAAAVGGMALLRPPPETGIAASDPAAQSLVPPRAMG